MKTVPLDGMGDRTKLKSTWAKSRAGLKEAPKAPWLRNVPHSSSKRKNFFFISFPNGVWPASSTDGRATGNSGG
jgi:hypothetical protein